MRWDELTSEQPVLSEVAHQLLIAPGVVLLGTIRASGSARISGVEPLIMEGHLWLSMLPGSMKVRDLYRDPRLVLNCIITGPEPAPEIKIKGTARAEFRDTVHERYAAAVASELGWRPTIGQFALFAVSIEDLTYIGYDPDTRGQHVARWPSGHEYVRPAITPTSLGPPSPVHRLLRTG